MGRFLVDAVGLTERTEHRTALEALHAIAREAGFRRLALCEVPKSARTTLAGGYFFAGLLGDRATLLSATGNCTRGYTLAVAVHTPDIIGGEEARTLWSARIGEVFGDASPSRLALRGDLATMPPNQDVTAMLGSWISGELV